MAVENETLLQIDSVQLPKVKGYSIKRSKLWTDANRNLAGTLRSTFIGIFPKVKVKFAPLTEDEMQTIIGLLDRPSFTLEFWDAKTKQVQSELYYSGDYDVDLRLKRDGLYSGFEVSLIPWSKE